MNKKFSKEFIELLDDFYRLREYIIWLPLSADDTEENLYQEICSYIKEYEQSQNIQNPPSETK